MRPKEVITGGQCVEEEKIQYTVKQLIQMLKAEVTNENIIDLGEKTGSN